MKKNISWLLFIPQNRIKDFFTTSVSDTDSGRAMTERGTAFSVFSLVDSFFFSSLSTCVLTIFLSIARIGRTFSSNRDMLRGTVERGEKKKETATHSSLWVGPKSNVD